MSPTRLRSSRTAVSVTIAAGLLLGPASAGAQTPPATHPTEPLCTNVPNDFELFEDTAGLTFEAEIQCLAWAEITLGTGEGDPVDPRAAYRPADAVTRAQMATFVARMMDVAWVHSGIFYKVEALGPDPEADYFADVGATDPHLVSINRLARSQIVNGGPGGIPSTHFGPDLPVTRAQMASFIAKADQQMRARMMPAGLDYFSDDDGNTHEGSINAIASLGIAEGVGGRRYSPDQLVTRGQMSAFIMRTLAGLHVDGLMEPITDYLDIAETELSSVIATDNRNGTATLRFDLRNYLDEPITGLTPDRFGLWYEGSIGPWADDLIIGWPDSWSFTEVGGGVYDIVHTSPTTTSTVFASVIMSDRSILATDLTLTVTGGAG